MSNEAYIRGFCKVAEANGVDPQALAKYAAQNVSQLEQQASDAMKRTAGPKGTTTMLDPKTQAILAKLQKARGRKITGYNSATGFTYGSKC